MDIERWEISGNALELFWSLYRVGTGVYRVLNRVIDDHRRYNDGFYMIMPLILV